MRQVQPHGHVSQVDSLRIQQLLVDRIEQRKIMRLDSVPQLCAILLAEKHDRLTRPGA